VVQICVVLISALYRAASADTSLMLPFSVKAFVLPNLEMYKTINISVLVSVWIFMFVCTCVRVRVPVCVVSISQFEK